LEAGKILQTRWSVLLSAVAKEAAFEMPSYEQPVIEPWEPTKEQAGIHSGPPDPSMGNYPPKPPRLQVAWEPRDFEQKAG
jgi:hypothetical protein